MPSKPVTIARVHLASYLGVSVGVLRGMLKQPDFPKPVKLGANTRAWVTKELDRWVASRKEPAMPECLPL